MPTTSDVAVMPEARSATVGDLAFRVHRTRHRSPRHPFVLIHGIGMSHRSFARLHPLLAATDDVISLDLPGFGGARRPPRDVDIPAMADALGDLLEGEGITDAVVVGHSMGTQWAIELAVRRPHLVWRVVAIGAVVDDRHRSLGAQMRALAADGLVEPPTTNGIVLTDYLRTNPGWYLAQVRHMLAYPTEDKVRMLTQPLLLVRGGRDPICGMSWSRRLRAAARHAHVVSVPGRGHHVEHQAPRATAAAIEAFLAATGTG
jgi:pimeloyl-ACP methyl ester carboxylesterase